MIQHKNGGGVLEGLAAAGLLGLGAAYARKETTRRARVMNRKPKRRVAPKRLIKGGEGGEGDEAVNEQFQLAELEQNGGKSRRSRSRSRKPKTRRASRKAPRRMHKGGEGIDGVEAFNEQFQLAELEQNGGKSRRSRSRKPRKTSRKLPRRMHKGGGEGPVTDMVNSMKDITSKIETAFSSSPSEHFDNSSGPVTGFDESVGLAPITGGGKHRVKAARNGRHTLSRISGSRHKTKTRSHVGGDCAQEGGKKKRSKPKAKPKAKKGIAHKIKKISNMIGGLLKF